MLHIFLKIGSTHVPVPWSLIFSSPRIDQCNVHCSVYLLIKTQNPEPCIGIIQLNWKWVRHHCHREFQTHYWQWNLLMISGLPRNQIWSNNEIGWAYRDLLFGQRFLDLLAEIKAQHDWWVCCGCVVSVFCRKDFKLIDAH